MRGILSSTFQGNAIFHTIFIVHGVVSNGKNANVHILKPNCIVFTALNYIFEVVLFIVNLSFSKELRRKIELEG